MSLKPIIKIYVNSSESLILTEFHFIALKKVLVLQTLYYTLQKNAENV